MVVWCGGGGGSVGNLYTFVLLRFLHLISLLGIYICVFFLYCMAVYFII